MHQRGSERRDHQLQNGAWGHLSLYSQVPRIPGSACYPSDLREPPHSFNVTQFEQFLFLAAKRSFTKTKIDIIKSKRFGEQTYKNIMLLKEPWFHTWVEALVLSPTEYSLVRTLNFWVTVCSSANWGRGKRIELHHLWISFEFQHS